MNLNRGGYLCAGLLKKFGYRVTQKALQIALCFMNWKEPELLEGENAVLKLPELIKSKGIKRVLVVTDQGLMSLHLLNPLFEALKAQEIEYFLYDDVKPNPTIPSIEECKDAYLKNNCEGIIAFVGYVHAIAHNLGGLYRTPHGFAQNDLSNIDEASI